MWRKIDGKFILLFFFFFIERIFCERKLRRKMNEKLCTAGSITCSSSFSMAVARITSGPLQSTFNQKIITNIQSQVFFVRKTSKLVREGDDLYHLTAYSIVLMHGLMFSIWRHFPNAPFDADMFLDGTSVLLHCIWDTDCDDRHKWRLSQLVRTNWSRVAICKRVMKMIVREGTAREKDGWWVYGYLFTTTTQPNAHVHILFSCWAYTSLDSWTWNSRNKKSFAVRLIYENRIIVQLVIVCWWFEVTETRVGLCWQQSSSDKTSKQKFTQTK